eukprot:gnl/MRDRNA2_/MRDRNA2_105073_c0_seq1.p1 gnl/MRDRNA2_/MRDRNA2_105073_c0~~gnl/MRDRNA2_/MRDRNA2_105073_c0_seq1.p1  ORF type:complete len:215 (-),score=23.30 gnl/MRDRNA2_/MRDRNA2_105073_c0_seq1:33-677(-)
MGADLVSAVPTKWALSMRKWVISLWFILLVLFIAKCLVLDVLGVVGMTITVLVGYLVPFGNPPMQLQWIICWGMFSMLNCIMDLILGIMYLVRYLNGMPAHPLSYFASTRMGGMQDENWRKRKLSSFEEYLEHVVLLNVIVGLVLPFVEIIIAWICYKLFQDNRQSIPCSADLDSDSSTSKLHSEAHDCGAVGQYGSTGHLGGGEKDTIKRDEP